MTEFIKSENTYNSVNKKIYRIFKSCCLKKSASVIKNKNNHLARLNTTRKKFSECSATEYLHLPNSYSYIFPGDENESLKRLSATFMKSLFHFPLGPQS